MGEAPGGLSGQHDQQDQPAQEADPAAIRADIGRTRAEMSETIDAIQERLSPQHLMHEAQGTLRDATVGKAEQMMNSANATARETGSGVWQTIKQNPLPAAMAGIGIGWLVMSGRSSHRGNGQMQRAPEGQAHRPSATEKVGETVDQAARRAGETAGSAVGEVQHQAERARSGFGRMLHEQPLAVGAVAVGLGAAVGLAVPETRKEDELMGEARERVMHRVESVTGETRDKVQRVAEEAQKAGKEEAKAQQLAA